MCARLLGCPLCSQPSFGTLDALRAGLVNVSTRPLSCPVCDEVLLGIDKLTIHLFGHTINQPSDPPGKPVEPPRPPPPPPPPPRTHQVPIQSWNVIDKLDNGAAGSIYIPIDEIDNFRNLTARKDADPVIPINNARNVTTEVKTSGQVILLQNVGTTQPKIYSTNLIGQSSCDRQQIAENIFQTATSNDTSGVDHANSEGVDIDETIQIDVAKGINGDSSMQGNWASCGNVEQRVPGTDRLAELMKDADITGSPMSQQDVESPPPPPAAASESGKPVMKSSRLLGSEELTARCDICGCRFASDNILALHRQLHVMPDKQPDAEAAVVKHFPCHLCTKVFKMRGSLMVHMRVAHPGFTIIRESAPKDQEEQPKKPEVSFDPVAGYKCPICGKYFKKEQHVNQHMKTHDGKTWECDVCHKMFTTKYFLKKHKRLHSGEMPYKCNICDKTFTFQQSYHKHRLYHKDEKPHTCTTCGRSFKELSTLHNHERIHTGEKPFACESCGKCFRQRVSYLVHRRIHTGVMPYKCTACGKSFRYKVSQRTHKCESQPPGTVVLQPGSLVQKLMKNEEKHNTKVSSTKDEQSMGSSTTTEDNQYVLVVSDEGKQTILKRKLDVGGVNKCDTNKSSTEKNNKSSDESNDVIRSIWDSTSNENMDHDKSDDIMQMFKNWDQSPDNKDDSRNSKDGISKNFSVRELSDEFTSTHWSGTLMNEDKNQASNSSEFSFSMLSPIENGISSPSAEMKHLRLSSPGFNQENSSEAIDYFPPMNSNANPVQVNNANVIGNFGGGSSSFSTLQNINEDSIKELLYSI